MSADYGYYSREASDAYVRKPPVRAAPTQVTDVTVVEKTGARKLRNSYIWIVVLAVLLLIAIVIIIWLAVSRGGSNKNGTSPLGHGCTTDRNCMNGLICSGGKCTETPNAVCVVDSDCPVNYQCTSGRCLGTQGSVCVTSSNCVSPLQCIANNCTIFTTGDEEDE